MPIFRYGKWHVWFAWKPVNTDVYGRRWLCRVWRRRWHADVRDAPSGWEYLPLTARVAPGLRTTITPNE